MESNRTISFTRPPQTISFDDGRGDHRTGRRSLPPSSHLSYRIRRARPHADGRVAAGSGVKDLEKITVHFDCDGPIGNIIAQADPNGNVRGYVANPQADATAMNQRASSTCAQ